MTLEEQVSSLRWRNIGPFRGGRSVAVVGHPTESQVFYFGSTGGGVWKTVNGGVTWENISDGYVNASSVGAIALSLSDPNILVVGMGESCIRGNVTFGDGVYKSTDGGQTWNHLGLADTRHISRVRIHPTNPDVMYVAALGHAFGPNPERGVFRTEDGGRTWQSVLYVNEDTGAIDLSMDPHNPRILYAAMWEGRRGAWSMVSGGPESGLYKSIDGGDHWTRLGVDNGLPTGTLGRIGVSVSGSDPNRVFAMVEAKDGGLYRSDDGGRSFKLTDSSQGLRSRPWYYTHIFADPQDANRVYMLAATFWQSIDGGKSFTAVPTPHGDHHDLWIDPERPSRMIHGADGGAVVSFDGGSSWSSIHNQPTSEFYHVTTDTQFPYRVYGAQQDNSTITVASRSHYLALGDREWYEVGGAESGYIQVRPDDPNIVYAGSSGGGEGGRLTRYDHRTKQKRDISVWPEKTAGVAARDYTYRFQWTSPILLSPFNPDVLYMCGNHVFRSTDDGQSWEMVSPDLTRNDPEKQAPSGGSLTLDHTGVEVYCTIFAFAESPVRQGMLWAGSDDGLVHLSRNNGQTWENVTPADLPEWSLVSIIEPSRHHPEVAYLAATRYKFDDPRPYLFKTADGGRTWTAIQSGIPDDEYTRVVREDPEVAGLLYAGTERGVYVSTDAGEHWERLRLNMPVVPVHDLEVRGADLVAASHGRSFWILDDVSPVRQLAAEPNTGALRLYGPAPTYRTTVTPMAGPWLRRLTDTNRPAMVMGHYLKERPKTGDAPVFMDAGQNAPPGVVFQYWLRDQPEGPVTLTIKDGQGQVVKELTSQPTKASGEPELPAAAGANRFVWDMKHEGAVNVEGSSYGWPKCAPFAVPGEYEAVLAVGREQDRVTFRLTGQPGMDTSDAEYQEQLELLLQVRDKVSAVHQAVNQMASVTTQLGEWEKRSRGHQEEELVTSHVTRIREQLEEVREALIQHRLDNFQDEINFPPKLNSKLGHVFQVVAASDHRPTRQSYQAFQVLSSEADKALGALRDIMQGAVAEFDSMVREIQLPMIRVE